VAIAINIFMQLKTGPGLWSRVTYH